MQEVESVKLRAMVLKWNERAGANVWVDYPHRRRSQQSLEDELNEGLKNGQWIRWRIIFGWTESGIR